MRVIALTGLMVGCATNAVIQPIPVATTEVVSQEAVQTTSNELTQHLTANQSHHPDRILSPEQEQDLRNKANQLPQLLVK